MKARGYTKETITHAWVPEVSHPMFRVGDTVAVHQRIQEGDKKRIQIFEGDVIAMRRHGVSTTFTVRKMGAHGVAVERIFPLYSPIIKEIKVVRTGDVRRAKLYYIRKRVGRAARLQEKIVREQGQQQSEEQALQIEKSVGEAK